MSLLSIASIYNVTLWPEKYVHEIYYQRSIMYLTLNEQCHAPVHVCIEVLYTYSILFMSLAVSLGKKLCVLNKSSSSLKKDYAFVCRYYRAAGTTFSIHLFGHTTYTLCKNPVVNLKLINVN